MRTLWTVAARARALWQRWVHAPGPTGLWKIGCALTLSFGVAIAGLIALGFGAWVVLRYPQLPHSKAISVHDAVGVAQLVFASVAGAGALVALVVSYRRQRVAETAAVNDRTRVLNERFTTIAAQLGDESAAVQLAGVHAMAGLADDWEENRQTCIDVLCAYLRIPYEPTAGPNAPAVERLPTRANREVRHTVIRVIAAHLREGASPSWQGLDFDFTGVRFEGGDFSDAVFSGGKVDFNHAQFALGAVSFDGAKFSGAVVGFDEAQFPSGVRFDGAVFSGGRVHFDGAHFSGGWPRFDGAKFSGSVVTFYSAMFTGGTVRFYGAHFSDGWVGFQRAEFSGSLFSFLGAMFSGGIVSFNSARFHSTVDFDTAAFLGGTVDFDGAELLPGGRVDFSRAADWSHPPAFDFDLDSPPPVVILPAEVPAESSVTAATGSDSQGSSTPERPPLAEMAGRSADGSSEDEHQGEEPGEDDQQRH